MAHAATVKSGDGSEQGVELDPIQNHQQYARVVELIEDARAKGYTFLTGGGVPQKPGYCCRSPSSTTRRNLRASVPIRRRPQGVYFGPVVGVGRD